MTRLSWLLIAVAAVGCKKKDAEKAPSAPSVTESKPATTDTKPAPATPPPAAPATPPPAAPDAKAPHAAAAFLKDVPAKPTTAKVGQLAWTIRGDSYDTADAHRVEVDEVVAVDGNTATTRPVALMASGADSWKHKPQPSERPFVGLPGQLVVPAHTVDEIKPKVGDNVFVFIGDAPTPMFAHVKAVAGGLVTFDVPNGMGDKTEEKKSDLVEPYGTGLAPFTYVTYKDGEDQKLATVLALDGDTVFAFGPGGNLVTLKKANVKSLKPEWKPRKVGDKVYRFSYGDGKAGEIKAVSIPDLVYKVDYSTVPWDMTFDKLP